MIDHSYIQKEWDVVKNVSSIYKHYGDKKLYQMWHNRFIRAGLKNRRNSFKRNKIIDNEYFREWHIFNPGRARLYLKRYYARKLGIKPPPL